MSENVSHLSTFWIGLSRDRLRDIIKYDENTGTFTWFSGDEAGTVDTNGYRKIQIDGDRYPAHVLAWFYYYGVWSMVDHKDGDRDNNAISNLRPTNYQLNAANRRIPVNSSGAKGVYFRNGMYEVGIKINQKRKYLGRYKTLEEAAEVYKQAAKEAFGEFANG